MARCPSSVRPQFAKIAIGTSINIVNSHKQGVITEGLSPRFRNRHSCRSVNFRVFKFSRISDFGTFHFCSAIIIIIFVRYWNSRCLLLEKFVKIKTSRILPDLHYPGPSVNLSYSLDM